MLIIPAIDIRGGKCVRLFQGDYGKETVYGEDPVEMARRWIARGAGFLHLVDLDGAREGTPRNREAIRRILKISSIPVQIGGGIRTLTDLEEYFSSGASRLILGTAAYADPGLVSEACHQWPGKIAVDIGPKTIALFNSKLGSAKTVVWNGPLGIFEMDAFSRGTSEIGKCLAGLKAVTIIGGGDTAAAVAKFRLQDKMTHISTGGGASLEFLEGKTLPGIAALTDK